ncbi:MAG: phage late control D family protein [Peptococcaceae bacterium]|jgi:hypothetical protein|nr:phage late control D family protein [Peptococcaceae bacterium]
MRAIVITAPPFEFTDILDVHIQKGANRHGYARIKGYIQEEMEEGYFKMALSETLVAIMAEDYSGTRQALFHGILEDMDISAENGMVVMELLIMPYSRLLDHKPEIRVFQNPSLTYNALVDAVLAPFDDAFAIVNAGRGQAIGGMFVQYQETAWAFLVRMASMENDVVVPNDILGGINLLFGFPEKASSPAPLLDPVSYEAKKNVGGYIYKRDNNVLNISENDSVLYIVKDREIRNLCDRVTFQGRLLYISSIESVWEGQELVHYYILTSRNGTRVPQSRNMDIIGASLDGQVSQVSGSKVKLGLPTAHENDTGVTKWHPFSTVYSSPDGTGWYAMPVAGDKLRLYFPTEVEDDGYTISAVHLNVKSASGAVSAAAPVLETDEEGEAPRTKEEKTLISNSFGKEIELTPTTIRITSGGKTILIDDEAGIFITSDTDIEISGTETVAVSSPNGSIVMIGEKTVTIEQENAMVELNEENVIFKGAQVRTE